MATAAVWLQASCVSRFLRQRQLPFLQRHRLELSRPISSFPRLEQVVWLPRAGTALFGELFTEVLGFLWPFLLEPTESLLGWPVLLPGCDPKDAYSAVLHQLLREQHTFPLLEQHLPDALHLERVLIPQPSFRLHAACTPVFLQAAEALADRLAQVAVARTDPAPLLGPQRRRPAGACPGRAWLGGAGAAGPAVTGAGGGHPSR